MTKLKIATAEQFLFMYRKLYIRRFLRILPFRVIKLFRSEGIEVPIMVGGAVLTRKYAEEIGADEYAKDAMEAVAKAKELLKKKNLVSHE